jgi:hypothetical protein
VAATKLEPNRKPVTLKPKRPQWVPTIAGSNHFQNLLFFVKHFEVGVLRLERQNRDGRRRQQPVRKKIIFIACCKKARK